MPPKKPAAKKSTKKGPEISKEKKEQRKRKLVRNLFKKTAEKKEAKAPAAEIGKIGKTAKTAKLGPKRRRQPAKETTYEVTMNLAKVLRGVSSKRKAPRGVRDIKRFTRNFLGTSDVRIDPSLNKYLWVNGISNPPRKLRLRLNRKPTEEEGKEGKFFVQVSNIIVDTFAGKKTERVGEPAAQQ